MDVDSDLRPEPAGKVGLEINMIPLLPSLRKCDAPGIGEDAPSANRSMPFTGEFRSRSSRAPSRSPVGLSVGEVCWEFIWRCPPHSGQPGLRSLPRLRQPHTLGVQT